MMPRKNRHGIENRSTKIVTTIFLLISICGLVWQVVNVFGLYFQYKVSTRIRIHIPDVLPPTETSMCTRFTDVLDYDRLNAETNRSWQFSITVSGVQKYQDEITVREIFEYTPDVSEVVARVVFPE